MAIRLEEEADRPGETERRPGLLRRLRNLIEPHSDPLEGAYIVMKGEPRATQVVFGDPATARRDYELMSRVPMEPLVQKWSRVPEEDLSERAEAVDTAARRYESAGTVGGDGRRAS